ncbi:hypothetical protein SPRG_13364 [Saprolegnia parasitica CBS 223.65]|uniref:START domain-containing protein n=1 Tax=Saprolegnia parasitica (strain CBS 223.65) TaxID=695850 RepID=A0A067BTG6_SAPPC|nr:hypothetical protein SPRG_13364 [Saprolegnia parasitica CBS 223.65]KDO21553.1 hypothetical protein SPRG_13364 [Saprolegnia parasitica CBS 223.65]|eukprot:XP_012207730.1 hypothetical protein SPRG_13364 [Saprolegnia parasitica CBS 223.65]
MNSLDAFVYDVEPLAGAYATTLDEDAMLDDIMALTDKASPASDEARSDHSAEAAPAKRTRVRKRQIDELKYLREKMDEYSSQLTALQQLKAVESQNSSPWEAISRRQAQARSLAEAENAKLKLAVEEQLKVTEALMRIVTKRPKLAEAACIDDWKVQKLPSSPVRRRNAMRSLVDAKREAMEGVFVRKQIQDAASAPMVSDVVYDAATDSVRLECSTVHELAVDYPTAVETMWEMHTITGTRTLASSQYRCLETVDATTVYYRRSFTLGAAPVEGNVIFARFNEPNRTVFVSETVLDDEAHPYSPNVFVSNETTWMMLEKTDVGARVRFCASAIMPCKASRDAPSSTSQHYVAFAELLLDSFKKNLHDMQMYVRGQVEARLGPLAPQHHCPMNALATKLKSVWRF